MLHVERLEVEELLLLDSAVVAGSTTGWAEGLTFALALPGGFELGHWPWPPLAASLCGWEKQSCGGKGV